MPTLPTPAADDALLAPPQRRFLDGFVDRGEATPTLIGRGSHFVGELSCQGDASVAGSGEGTLRVGGVFILSDHAHWRGIAHCQQAVLAGRFEGELHVAGKVEVRATAQVQGQLHAGQLAIAAGAIVGAAIHMAAGARIERYTEQRDG